MAQEFFDPVLFIKEDAAAVVDLSQTPFFCNVDGYPSYCATPGDLELLETAASNPDVVLGKEYDVLSAVTSYPQPQYGNQTRMEFRAHTVEYEAVEATPQAAAAFGMTLVAPGQAIRVASPQPHLALVDYEYGMFAGHQSPYQGTGSRLLGTVCTDLEHHDFPHVFTSLDPHLPLVISVGKYWPERKKIYLADLWVPRGRALYVPPRPPNQGLPFMDLHGNRNSALACWRGIGRSSVRTQTLLQTEGGYFYWFWNPLPAVHPLLDLAGPPHV